MRITGAYLVKYGNRIEKLFHMANGHYVLEHMETINGENQMVHTAIIDLSPQARKSLQDQLSYSNLHWKELGTSIRGKIEVIPSSRYKLLIKDGKGTYHYWNNDGFYDGVSKDEK